MKEITEALLALPRTPENTEKKIDFIVAHVEHLVISAEKAQKAAERAADIALRQGQRYEPLSRFQRFAAVALGAATGGAMISIVIQIAAILVLRK